MAIPRNLANIAPHVNASSTELVVNDGGANLDFRVEGDTNANLLFADAGAEKVGFGTNTFNTNGGVIQVSNGISFPATQSACADVNTLDDYEEGSWTPVLSRTGSSYTFGGQGGIYTKIGDTVICSFSCNISAIGTQGTGFNTISGFPFTPRANYGGSGRFTGPLSFKSVLTSATAIYWAGAFFFTDGTNALQTNFTTGDFSGVLIYQI